MNDKRMGDAAIAQAFREFYARPIDTPVRTAYWACNWIEKRARELSAHGGDGGEIANILKWANIRGFKFTEDDAKEFLAAACIATQQPASGEVCPLGCTDECKAKLHGCPSECPKPSAHGGSGQNPFDYSDAGDSFDTPTSASDAEVEVTDAEVEAACAAAYPGDRNSPAWSARMEEWKTEPRRIIRVALESLTRSPAAVGDL